MDYPKSVPNVGLIDGKFVDENTTSGVVGSLIPSAWGNSVTDEILAVIRGAGLEPDEANHGQLLAALNNRFSRIGTAGGFGRRNVLINAKGTINTRGYASGAATTVNSQFTLDRWYVVTSGQNLSWVDTAGVRIFSAPSGGVAQAIRASNVYGGTYVLSYNGTAVCRINGVVVASGATVVLPSNTVARVAFANGTFSQPQLELGNVPTSFDFQNDESEELICHKYFFRPLASWTIAGNATVAGQRIMDAMLAYPKMISATPTASVTSSSGTNITVGLLTVTDRVLTQVANSVTTGAASYLFSVNYIDAEFT